MAPKFKKGGSYPYSIRNKTEKAFSLQGCGELLYVKGYFLIELGYEPHCLNFGAKTLSCYLLFVFINKWQNRDLAPKFKKCGSYPYSIRKKPLCEETSQNNQCFMSPKHWSIISNLLKSTGYFD